MFGSCFRTLAGILVSKLHVIINADYAYGKRSTTGVTDGQVETNSELLTELMFIT